MPNICVHFICHLSNRTTSCYHSITKKSLPTIDSHYNQVKSGDRSLVSDAEGTFGTNNPSLTGFSQADRSAYGTVATPAQAVGFGGNNSIEGQLLKDYYGSNQPAHLMASPIQQLKEEMLEIYAPAGRLGLVIDCPTSEDTPIVHAIKDTCPIRSEIYVGDKLVAVDDEDVREFNAVQVSRLISKKSEQKRRKLTIIRTSRGRDGMY